MVRVKEKAAMDAGGREAEDRVMSGDPPLKLLSKI